MKLSDKILIRHEKIKSIKKDEISSAILFYNKMSVATDVLNVVQKYSGRKKMIIEARKNFIINCVTAMEVYLKDAILNGDFTFSNERCEELLKDRISLYEAFQMFSEKKLDVRDVIVSYYSFQRMETIDSVFSNILGRKFFNELEKHEVDETETDTHFFQVKPYTLDANFPKWRQQLSALFELRHDCVHQINFNAKISYTYVKSTHALLYAFIIACGSYFRLSWSRFFDDLGKELGISPTK